MTTPASGDHRLLIETLGAAAVAIGLSGLATWLSDVTVTASQRTAAAFYLDLVSPLTFTCLAVVRLRRQGASRWTIAGVLLAGLIVTGLISGVLDRLINCHFGNCTSLVDG